MEHQNLVRKIFKEVILPGNCFHCGLCEGLTNNLFKMKESKNGPIPNLMRKPIHKDLKDLKKIFIACPGRGVPYNFLLNKGKAKNKNNIIGNYNSIFTASSNSKIIRQNGSSGGIVRTLLLEMIKKKRC